MPWEQAAAGVAADAAGGILGEFDDRLFGRGREKRRASRYAENRPVYGAADRKEQALDFEQVLPQMGRSQRQANEIQREHIKAMGLTPQEAAGVSSGAGAGGAPSGTLGNGPQIAQQQQRRAHATEAALQRAWQSRENALDRQQRTRELDIQSRGKDLEADRFAVDTYLRMRQEDRTTIEWNEGKWKADFQIYLRSLGMSVKNILGTGVYASWAARGYDVLNPQQLADPKRRAGFRSAFQELIALEGRASGEALALASLAGVAVDATGIRQIDDMDPGRSKSWLGDTPRQPLAEPIPLRTGRFWTER